MTQSTHRISPLRQRMIDDMRMRNFSPSTQRNYIRSVRDFAAYLKRSPDQAKAEELRQYLVHLTDNGISPTSYNACLPALKFFFQTTLDRPEVVRKLRTQPTPTRLPKVLSRDEVRRLLEATTSLKYKAAFSIAYGAGLRVSEVVNLKVGDIDSRRMCLRVEQGKGKKDRHAQLSPVLLDTLRHWWREGKRRRQVLDNGWLFPSRDPVNPLSTRQVSRVFKAAAAAAELDPKYSMHSLRHSYATHLLEDKVDIRIIQTLLGHSKIETTTRYTQVANSVLQEVTSPLDTLNPATQ
ncbi:MAG: site-specific integrase [Gammaproteobacteria bacterium]|nr:site-specific integrase [Gammaproteobacteria bacterium]MCP5445257.1 site-specific integrase [Chromatiaceae bacterium]